jgi:hypothetical protein
MDQELGNQASEQPEPILFSNNPNHVNEILKHGIDVLAVIRSYDEQPDPSDDEHSIIHLGFDYEVDGHVIQREIKFSINMMHIAYGFSGGLLNSPKFKYSPDDFRKSMQPGQKLNVKVLEDQPDEFVMETNEVMAEIMRHDAVWR